MNREKVIQVIGTISIVPEEEIQSEDLLESIGIDSLGKVELMVALEDTFGITFDVSDLDPEIIQTVDDVIRLTNQYVN